MIGNKVIGVETLHEVPLDGVDGAVAYSGDIVYPRQIFALCHLCGIPVQVDDSVGVGEGQVLRRGAIPVVLSD